MATDQDDWLDSWNNFLQGSEGGGGAGIIGQRSGEYDARTQRTIDELRERSRSGDFNLGGGKAGEGRWRKTARGTWVYDSGAGLRPTMGGPGWQQTQDPTFGLGYDWGESRYIDDGSGNMVPNPNYDPSNPNWYADLFNNDKTGRGDSWWDSANKNKLWQALLAAGGSVPGIGQILGLGQMGGNALNDLFKYLAGNGSGIPGSHDPSATGPGGENPWDVGGFDSGWVPPEYRDRSEMGGGFPGGQGGGGGLENGSPGGGGPNGDPSGGGPGGGGGNWPGQGGPMGPNTYGYEATGVTTSGPLQNQGGGAMPYGQQGGGGAAAYDPFSPMNLWEPMSKQMDYQAARQNAALKEKFGAQGLRWSSPMMSAQQQLGRQTNEDQQRLMSQLMYQGAQDTYGRQKDSAQMQMQLGQMQDQRDAQLSGQMFQQGMAEQGMSNQDLAAYYQEYLRMNPDYISQLLGSMVGPYSGQFQRQQSSADQWAPWLTAILSGAGSYYGSQNSTKTT